MVDARVVVGAIERGDAVVTAEGDDLDVLTVSMRRALQIIDL